MRNYETIADIASCKECIYNHSVAKGFSKYVCPLLVDRDDIDRDGYCSKILNDDWFCANGTKGGKIIMHNYEIADDNIVRCKDCINNPSRAKGFRHMCPLDDYDRDEIYGDEYYSETINNNWEGMNGNWFCANGEK